MIGMAVVGYGYWGPNLVRNLWETPGVSLVSVCDLRVERLATVRTRYPTVETTDDYDALLQDPRIDVVAVATPVSSHYLLALRALQAGKHVFIEKPMTATTEQAQRLVDEARRRNLVIGVDHTFIYTGAVRKMRELVEAGDLGEVYYYDSTRVNLGLFQHDVNVIWDLAVHDLAIMDYVLPGQLPVAVSATGLAHLPGEPENIAYLTVFFAGNLIAHVNVNWLAPVKVRRTLLGGSRKMIVYDDLEPSEKIKVYDKGITVNGASPQDGEKKYQMLVGYRAGDMWAPQLEITEALAVELKQFVSCVEQRLAPLTDGEAGLRVVRILEAATRSMADRGKVVELESVGQTV
ncbi:MAG: Gfo/Idh/MocA family oxidoreductase [Acidobacteriota bacterium]